MLRPYLPRAHGKLSMLSTLYKVGTAEFMINCCFPHLWLASLPLPSPSSCYNLSRPFAFPEKKACFGFEGLVARAGGRVVTKALCVPSWVSCNKPCESSFPFHRWENEAQRLMTDQGHMAGCCGELRLEPVCWILKQGVFHRAGFCMGHILYETTSDSGNKLGRSVCCSTTRIPTRGYEDTQPGNLGERKTDAQKENGVHLRLHFFCKN